MRRTVPFLIAAALCICSFAPATFSQTGQSLTGLSDSFGEISRKVAGSVVQIYVTGYTPMADGPGGSLVSKQRGTGSGVILDANGYIITNYHVVRGAKRVQVVIPYTAEELAGRQSILQETGTVVGGQVIGFDRETDLAVVKVQRKGLPSLELGDSDELHAGEIVLAFGSPLGLNNSVSMGVVSSVARQLRSGDTMVYIQTDATINPGNSGGALVNAEGKLVGINTLIFSQSGGSEGIGFSIPVNIVKNIFQQIRASGHVRRGEIGVYAQTITPEMAKGLVLDRKQGVVLGDVYPGGPAEEAGLQAGDVIVALDGKPMENGRQLHVNIYGKKLNQPVKLTYLRRGKEMTASVNVVERRENADQLGDLSTPEDNLVPRLGILGINLNRQIARLLPLLRKEEGVVVAAQSSEGPAWRERFYPGDVIFGINGEIIRNLEGLNRVLTKYVAGDPVVAQIQRGPRMQFISFEME